MKCGKRTMTAGMWGVLLLLLTLVSHKPAEAQSLTSIGVTPDDPTIGVGQSQAFKSTMIFGDGSSRELNPGGTVTAGADHTCALLADGSARP